MGTCFSSCWMLNLKCAKVMYWVKLAQYLMYLLNVLSFQLVLEMKIKNSILFHKVPSNYNMLNMYLNRPIYRKKKLNNF